MDSFMYLDGNQKYQCAKNSNNFYKINLKKRANIFKKLKNNLQKKTKKPKK